jgi:hypothetical protein
MSQELPLIFQRLQNYKKERRELKTMYQDALKNNGEYQKIISDVDDLKIKKKQFESSIKSNFKAEMDKLEGIKLHIASDNQLLSDLALNQLVKGELTKLVDEHQVEYEPIFTVKFKKTG